MKSIMGLSSMASLGTLVEIRELHLGLSWECIGSNNKINGSDLNKKESKVMLNHSENC
jgi:hypothetical protein